ncbi:hypothetical protein Tco_0127979 [Tanacetum coccineum]
MSTNEQTPLSQPTSVVRNTLRKEPVSQDPGRLISDESLREYCDRNYHQILPIIAGKVQQEKVQQEKLKAVKSHLNFEETLRHSKSGSPKPRHDRPGSPKKKGPERKAVFKREEIVAKERERKARTTLLMAIPEDHLAKFHKMTDAKDMWNAIKSRFGGNDESKKMQKYIFD